MGGGSREDRKGDERWVSYAKYISIRHLSRSMAIEEERAVEENTGMRWCLGGEYETLSEQKPLI